MALLGNELRGVDQFIFAHLAADTALAALVGTRIYAELAPEGSVLPFVVFLFLSSPDRTAIGATQRIFTRPLYLIKGVTEGNSFGPADAIADRIDQLLVGQSGTADSGGLNISGCYREEPIRYVEVPPDQSGRRYNHLGGRYRLFAHTVS